VTSNKVKGVCLENLDSDQIARMLRTFGLNLVLLKQQQRIPSSFWGEPEAGIVRSTVFARPDTPIHSVLHEACHFICMSDERRQGLDTDAGGDYDEENAVCYLQILLADRIDGFNRDQCMVDMDNWGYTFRLGSARAWFESDAEDAREWLSNRGLINF